MSFLSNRSIFQNQTRHSCSTSGTLDPQTQSTQSSSPDPSSYSRGKTLLRMVNYRCVKTPQRTGVPSGVTPRDGSLQCTVLRRLFDMSVSVSVWEILDITDPLLGSRRQTQGRSRYYYSTLRMIHETTGLGGGVIVTVCPRLTRVIWERVNPVSTSEEKFLRTFGRRIQQGVGDQHGPQLS